MFTPEQSGAFIDQFTLAPTRSGPLDGLAFAVKDLIDVAGQPSGCGNPDWLRTHPPARASAVCVDQLLAAGASCVGKTVCDELAFSLIGDNFFYGTPLNPAAPDRVPGGSSSGSASAVACGLADFALGTDTGGSVRIPASNCGLWGMRPTHGAISVAGVMPFAPGFDTVGILARSADILAAAMSVLLGSASVPSPLGRGQGEGALNVDSPILPDDPTTVHLIPEVFAMADPEVTRALAPSIDKLRAIFPGRVHETSLADLCRDSAPVLSSVEGAADLMEWLRIFRLVRGAEVESCLGAWIAATNPKFGPHIADSFELVRNLDRSEVGPAIYRRESLARALQQSLGPRDLLCIPTAPAIAPLKATADEDRRGNYYTRTICFTSLAGIARLPQISMPAANIAGAPIALSLLAAPHQDAWLTTLARP